MRTAPDLMYETMKTISYVEIRERLVRHHHPTESPDVQTIKVSHSSADTSGEDVIFFALSGCPPEGYGIFMQGRKRLILYTTRGMPFEQISVDEVTAVRT